MRTRQIHPRFWISESVASVGFFERLLFQATWGMADREGLLLYRPGEMRPQMFPHDQCVTKQTIIDGIETLVKAGLVVILDRIDGVDDPAIFIPKFKEYQWINKDEAKSKLIHLYFIWDDSKSIWVHNNPRQSYSYTPILCTPMFDKSITQSPPAPRKRGRVVAAELKEDVAKIVDHLNAVTGKRHGAEKATGEIERCLNAGATVAECCEVIDHCWAQWKDNPKMVKFVNKVTPFRAIHFDAYLDEARAGRPKPKPAPKPVEDDDPDLSPAEREAARQALERLGVGGLCNWT